MGATDSGVRQEFPTRKKTTFPQCLGTTATAVTPASQAEYFICSFIRHT